MHINAAEKWLWELKVHLKEHKVHLSLRAFKCPLLWCTLDVSFHFHIMLWNQCCCCSFAVYLEYRVLKVVVVSTEPCDVFVLTLAACAGVSAATSEASVYYKCTFCSDHTSAANFKPPCWTPQPAGEQTPRVTVPVLTNWTVGEDGLTQNVLLFITQMLYPHEWSPRWKLFTALKNALPFCWAHFKSTGNFISRVEGLPQKKTEPHQSHISMDTIPSENRPIFRPAPLLKNILHFYCLYKATAAKAIHCYSTKNCLQKKGKTIKYWVSNVTCMRIILIHSTGG